MGRKQRDKGRQDIDIHLLKPNRFRADSLEQQVTGEDLVNDEDQESSEEYVAYPYIISHPILRILPMKLAHTLETIWGKSFKVQPSKRGQNGIQRN